jgi:hypothetical protein
MNSDDKKNPATPEMIAALRAHRDFAQAMRASAAGLVAMYEGSHLLNWLMDDRARVVFGYFALYLHVTRDPEDSASGLTPTQMKALCRDFDLCSPGRAVVILSLMRFAGYLAPDPRAADRRQRRLVATDKLMTLLRDRWRLHFAAMAPLLPDGEAMLASLDDPAFTRFLVIAMCTRFKAGFRFIAHAPGLSLFSERNAGMMILANLMTAGEEGDAMPPTGPVPVSISALARRFSVSRPHVLKLLRDAAEEGYIERFGDSVVILPRLVEAAQTFFAVMFLLYADCAREAMRESAHGLGAEPRRAAR